MKKLYPLGFLNWKPETPMAWAIGIAFQKAKMLWKEMDHYGH
jgi:hypothetical protein